VVQAGGTEWCDDGDVIVVRCSGRGAGGRGERKLQDVGMEGSRT
jgi:hypothetical protein